MEHKQHICPHCFPDWQRAVPEVQDFVHHFQLLPNGLLHHCLTGKAYGFDDVTILSIISCSACTTCTYLIKTIDGLLGQAIEFWEHYG